MGIRGACVVVAAWAALGAARACAEPDDAGVTPASHTAGRDGQFDRVQMVRELMRLRGGDAAAAAQLVQLCRGFAPAEAAGAFEELAHAHEAAGAINLAADARLLLIQNHPGEPLARQALLWLTRLYASSEVAHRHQVPGQTASADAERGAALYAYHLADGLASVGGKRSDDPALVFARAAAARRAGLDKPAATLLTSLEHARAAKGWRQCAQVEAWLADSQRAAPPKPVVRCVRAAEAPRLDGVIDEACWGDAVGPVGQDEAKTQAMRTTWAWDDDYLYVAVRCAKRAGVAYPRDDRPRARDADLAAFDRVRLLVDVDRDYATSFELTVDSRGWTADACWGDAAWDPRWFVAAGSGEGAWVAEAAIRWKELGVAAPKAGMAWAVGAERIEAGGAVSQPVGPEGFGVLLFE